MSVEDYTAALRALVSDESTAAERAAALEDALRRLFPPVSPLLWEGDQA